MTVQEAPKEEPVEAPEKDFVPFMANKIMGTYGEPLPDYRKLVERAYFLLKDREKERDEARGLLRDVLYEAPGWHKAILDKLLQWAKEDR